VGRTVLLRDDGLDELDAVDGTEGVVLLALHTIMDTQGSHRMTSGSVPPRNH
jgi:hypothetical protein